MSEFLISVARKQNRLLCLQWIDNEALQNFLNFHFFNVEVFV